jgi:hypothetical protein
MYRTGVRRHYLKLWRVYDHDAIIPSGLSGDINDLKD